MNALGSQNEEVYPEKVEMMMVDPAQEAIQTFSLGDDRSVHRRHSGVFPSSECCGSEGPGEDPLVVVDNFRTR